MAKRCKKDLHDYEGKKCPECHKVRSALWKAKNPGYYKQWREENPNYDSEYYQKHKEKYTEYSKNYRLQKYYNSSLPLIEEMKINQDNKCAICFIDFCKTPHIDHCHTTKTIRGLLCGPCNLLLGLAKDNPETLRNAADYLEGAKHA